ncbi:rhomboid family intramembrane serine protease [Nocardiopsis coralliicola]
MSADEETAPGTAAVPRCYRHPERETHISCTRCGRPICPDCMNEAAVGHQCPACVAEGNRSVRSAKTVFGGRPTRAPYVTWTLLGLMVAGFVAQTADDAVGGGQLTGLFAMNPWRIAVHGDWYLLLTAAFLHGGVLHLAFNGFALYAVGRQIEEWLGHVRYAALWILSAAGGSVLTLAVDLATGQAQLSVGASGAVFGLFGAALVIGRRLQLDMRFILGLLAVNLLITFMAPNISWTAHIGGLAVGAVLAAAFAYLPRNAAGARGRQQAAVHAAAGIAVAAVLAGIALAAVAWVPV